MLPPGLTEELPPAMPSTDHVTPLFTRPLNDGAELLGLHNGQRGEVGTELLPLPRTGLDPRVLSQNRDFPKQRLPTKMKTTLSGSRGSPAGAVSTGVWRLRCRSNRQREAASWR